MPILLLLVFLHSFTWPTFLAAQNAEPLRIQVKPGSHGTLVKGTLQGRQQMEYVVEMRNGQSVTLALESRSLDELKIRLRNPKNTDLTLSHDGSHRWTATVTESGDYEIWVVRMGNTPGESSYKLRITIR